MTSAVTLESIDTSYWKTLDKVWMAERKAQWPAIEKMFKGRKSSKGITIIKQYYMKGKMPDWDKLAYWDSWDRHLDIFVFLWLHPSWDISVLRLLKELYFNSDKIVVDDLRRGYSSFLDSATNNAAANHLLGNFFPETDGHNEMLFDILMDDFSGKKEHVIERMIYGRKDTQAFQFPKSELDALALMTKWLCLKKENMLPLNHDMLFQYDRPLEWWYQSCDVEEDYFDKRKARRALRPLIEKALWRIYNFDTEKEGGSSRTRFVFKMRKILDERPFIQDIKTMWARVKNGEVSVKDPWKW